MHRAVDPHRKLKIIGILVAMVIAVGLIWAGAVAAVNQSAAQASPVPTAQTTATAPRSGDYVLAPTGAPTTLVAPAPTNEIIKLATTMAPGSYTGDMDIQAGLWITKGGKGCGYSRNAGASWRTTGSPTQQVVVSIQPGATFDTHACAPWTLLRAY